MYGVFYLRSGRKGGTELNPVFFLKHEAGVLLSVKDGLYALEDYLLI